MSTPHGRAATQNPIHAYRRYHQLKPASLHKRKRSPSPGLDLGSTGSHAFTVLPILLKSGEDFNAARSQHNTS